jgi:N-acetylglutamate synthase
MVVWPDLGTRISVRYRRPAGSVPPLTDAVGHLMSIEPVVRVRTRAGQVVEFAPSDAVALRVVPDAPVRTSQIRSLEHAAAAAWPGVDQTWVDGWLLRAHGVGVEANSAVPLGLSVDAGAIPAIAAWYAQRGLPALLLIPDRLLRPTAGLVLESKHRVLVCDLNGPDGSFERHTGVQVNDESHASATFGAEPGGAATRAAVTDAPDGTRWVGLSAIGAADSERARGVCEALLAWGSSRGATRAYLRATGGTGLAESLGFRLHHHSRYFRLADNL